MTAGSSFLINETRFENFAFVPFSGPGLDPAAMASRLGALWDRYRFDDVNFQDETFFTKRERVQDFAERLLASGMAITWAATMRADQGVRGLFERRLR